MQNIGFKILKRAECGWAEIFNHGKLFFKYDVGVYNPSGTVFSVTGEGIACSDPMSLRYYSLGVFQVCDEAPIENRHIWGCEGQAAFRYMKLVEIGGVELCLKYNICPSVSNGFFVKWTAIKGKHSVLEELLKRVNDRQVSKECALYYAVRSNSVKTVQVLIDRGADPSANEQKAIRWANTVGINPRITDVLNKSI